MVPPQFTPHGASWDPSRSAGCTGPYPSSPTLISGKPLRKEFRVAASTAFHLPAALWESGWARTGFHHCVALCVFLSLPPGAPQVNKKTRFFPHFSARSAHLSAQDGNWGSQTTAPTDSAYHKYPPLVNTYSPAAEFFCLLHDFGVLSLWRAWWLFVHCECVFIVCYVGKRRGVGSESCKYGTRPGGYFS